jgi:hypothetical protein
LKVGVEGTIALVADSQQDVDWAKAGNPKGMTKEKWKTLVKAAKPHSKKILAFLSPKPVASTNCQGGGQVDQLVPMFFLFFFCSCRFVSDLRLYHVGSPL